MKRYYALVLIAIATVARGFLPPVPSILKEIFESRKPFPAVEVVLRHRIVDRAGGATEIDERLVREGSRTYCLWRVAGQSYGAIAERQSYVLSHEKSIPTKSVLYRAYLLSHSAESFQNLLIAEGFLRPDQLYQFKPGFNPEGDPRTWEIKENYLRHDDIFLRRLPQGVGIAVVGSDNGAVKKTIIFDPSLRGIFRWEWNEGGQIVAWKVLEFTKTKSGDFPRKMTLEVSGVDVVTTEVSEFRALKPKQLVEFKNALKSALRNSVLPSPLESVFQMILGHR